MKVVAGTPTILAQFEPDKDLIHTIPVGRLGGGHIMSGTLSLSVQADGTWELSAGPNSQGTDDILETEEVIASGSDTDLATAGALDDGRVGIYHASEEANAAASIDAFSVNSGASTFTTTTVVREGGIGEFTHEDAITAETTNALPAPIPFYQGSRIFLQPGDSRLAFRLHPNDLDQEPATDDYAGSVHVVLWHRPAWVTVPDSLEP